MMKKMIFSIVLAAMGLAAQAQTFETGLSDYTAVSTYDSWADSPFRTGRLAPNAAVVDNPFRDSVNPTEKCAAYQRSRHAGNLYGIRIDLAKPFELVKDPQYIHVLIHRPKDGRVMCIGLGRKRGVGHQEGRDIEQFKMTSMNEIGTGEWCDAVFKARGAGDIDITSLVIVTDMESPHNLTADHLAYVDEIVITNDPTPRIPRKE